MSRHTVASERDLPSAIGAYVRCASEPTVVSHPKTGDAYVRADGAPWRHAGYRWEGEQILPRAPKDGFSDPGQLIADTHYAGAVS
jgi:hypothetical protein